MLTADRLAGGLVLLKAVDVVLRGPVALPGPLWAAAVTLLVAGGIALLTGRAPRGAARAGWAAVLLGGIAVAVDYPLELRRQHLVLLIAVALGALVARDDGERVLLWRVQLTALYGVAALAKLNESFLGGDVLARAVLDGPFWPSPLQPPALLLVLAGVGLIVTEGALAVTPWVAALRRPGTVVAALLHAVALLLVSAGPLVALRLFVFGGTAVLLHATSAGVVRPAPRPADSRQAPRSGNRTGWRRSAPGQRGDLRQTPATSC
jgi:hypothetical protein